MADIMVWWVPSQTVHMLGWTGDWIKRAAMMLSSCLPIALDPRDVRSLSSGATGVEQGWSRVAG